MKLLVQTIYRVPVTPACHIIDFDEVRFSEFLKADDDKRRIMVCEEVDKDPMRVKEVTWFPLDGQDKVISSCQDDNTDKMVKVIVPANHIRIIFRMRYRDGRISEPDALTLEFDEWMKFLHGDARVRVHVVCQRLGCDDTSDTVKEVVWFIYGNCQLHIKGEEVTFEKAKPERRIITDEMIDDWIAVFSTELWCAQKADKNKVVPDQYVRDAISRLNRKAVSGYIKEGLSPMEAAYYEFF